MGGDTLEHESLDPKYLQRSRENTQQSAQKNLGAVINRSFEMRET